MHGSGFDPIVKGLLSELTKRKLHKNDVNFHN